MSVNAFIQLVSFVLIETKVYVVSPPLAATSASGEGHNGNRKTKRKDHVKQNKLVYLDKNTVIQFKTIK